MIREFEGKSEREAIEKAVEELGLESTDFDVEIIASEAKKGFLFKKSVVRIRVHVPEDKVSSKAQTKESQLKATSHGNVSEHTREREERAKDFLHKMIENMGYSATITAHYDDEGRMTLDITSPEASVIIGRKGKNLDALQLLVSVYLNTIYTSSDEERVVVDAENYRKRREEVLYSMALKNASLATKQRRSRLLEPMNPFERRIIHTALSNYEDVVTQSEGEGLYKQVRIIYKGVR